MSKTSTPAREHKSFRFEVKAVDDAQGLIEAYGSVFDVVDQGDDVVKPGAFKRTIQNSKARVQAGKAKFLAAMLWQHDANQPIGGWTSLQEDAHGLLCKGQIVLSTQLGRECYELIKAGVLTEFSIGYDIPNGGANYDKSTGYRNLTEVRLWEVSPVTFAMNQEALLVGVKSALRKPMDKKTLQQHYAEEMCSDLLEDWQDVYLCALTKSILDALKIGDQPEQDISQALDDFKTLVLEKFVTQAQECNLSQFLTDSAYSSADYTMQYGSESSPSYGGYMSRHMPLEGKVGRAISATNQQSIDAHTKSLHDMANKAMKDMKAHTKALHSAADDLATVLQGSEPAYGDGEGTPDEGQQEGKSASRPALGDGQEELDAIYRELQALSNGRRPTYRLVN